MKKLFTRRTLSLALACVLVFSGGFLANRALAAATSGVRRQVLTGAVDEARGQVLYTIPRDAPDTVVLDGRQMIDYLLLTGQSIVPGSWMGGWMGVRNQSSYRYRVTDVTFQIDHSFQQSNSAILKKLGRNPYLIGPLHADRPSAVSEGSTGVIGFDGAEIPKSMAVLRSPSNALAGCLGTPQNGDITLQQAAMLDETSDYAQLILDYYKNHAKFAGRMQNVRSLAELPQECVVDLLGGANYRLWAQGDPTGRGRWAQGDIKLFAQNTSGRSVPVYAVYDARMSPSYYYVDLNLSGVSAPDTKVDVKQAAVSLIAPSWETSGNPFFAANRLGSGFALREDISWRAENGNGYLLETNPEVLKLAYERFYSDLLSFTFDSSTAPLLPGEQELRIDREQGKYTWSEITEGGEGLHWLDYMRMNETARQAVSDTVGAWSLAPQGDAHGGDYRCTYTNLKLSGQNTTNNYAGTDLMRGLTFTVTLERETEPGTEPASSTPAVSPSEEPTQPGPDTTAPISESETEESESATPVVTAPGGVTSPSVPQEPTPPELPDTGGGDAVLYLMAVVFAAAAVGLIAMAAEPRRRAGKKER